MAWLSTDAPLAINWTVPVSGIPPVTAGKTWTLNVTYVLVRALELDAEKVSVVVILLTVSVTGEETELA
jgi:hypothetical protein